MYPAFLPRAAMAEYSLASHCRVAAPAALPLRPDALETASRVTPLLLRFGREAVHITSEKHGEQFCGLLAPIPKITRVSDFVHSAGGNTAISMNRGLAIRRGAFSSALSLARFQPSCRGKR